MTALPPVDPGRTPPSPRPVPPLPLPPGFVKEDAAERARPDAGPTAPPPATWPPANDGTGPCANGPFAGPPSRRPEPRDPWAIVWTAVSSVVTTSVVQFGALFAYISPIWCDSCNDAELHRFTRYFWGYCTALLIPVILVIGGASLPPYKRYATTRITFMVSAMALSVLLPVLYYELLGTVR